MAASHLSLLSLAFAFVSASPRAGIAGIRWNDTPGVDLELLEQPTAQQSLVIFICSSAQQQVDNVAILCSATSEQTQTQDVT